jgi:hypothetical protein
MPTLDELRQLYAGYSLELDELTRSELTPDARLALSEELEKRHLSPADCPPSDGTASQRVPRHRGWITVFPSACSPAAPSSVLGDRRCATPMARHSPAPRASR